jgi:hypothetical protein
MSAQDLLEVAIVLHEEGEGRSRFGGTGPEVPGLDFIAAVDLAEMPRLRPLPEAGALLFYWDFEFFERERMDWVVSARVVHTPTAQLSGGAALTGTLGKPAGVCHQLLGISRDIQGPVLDEIPYWFEQGFPETRKNYSESELRGEGWMLLAQFESSGDLMFGDAGAVYYVLPEADVRAGRFERAMGIMQCS